MQFPVPFPTPYPYPVGKSKEGLDREELIGSLCVLTILGILAIFHVHLLKLFKVEPMGLGHFIIYLIINCTFFKILEIIGKDIDYSDITTNEIKITPIAGYITAVASFIYYRYLDLVIFSTINIVFLALFVDAFLPEWEIFTKRKSKRTIKNISTILILLLLTAVFWCFPFSLTFIIHILLS